MKNIIKAAAVAFAVLIALAPAAGAYYSYKTYTYDINGDYMESPDAYVPSETVDSESMGISPALENPTDIFVDDKQNVYIADAGNNRIVVLNKRFKLRYYIEKFTNSQGIPDTFNNPQGVFVTETNIYVCDTDNNRIVVFDRDARFVRVVEKPVADEISVDDLYRPKAVAVDRSGRMYVVSASTYQGIIAMDGDGVFQGFIGAQKTSLSAWEIFWLRFQTQEQRDQKLQNVSTEYENITIDDDGMIYVTNINIKDSDQQGAITGKSITGEFAPVKKLNTQGNEILKRNGFFPPSGEVRINWSASTSTNIYGPSKIVDVALGPQGTWSIIDKTRSKVFTYDENGSLLFIFGDQGSQLGNMETVSGVVYMGNDLLILDNTADNITVFKRTEYGDILISALENQKNLNYDEAADDWRGILMRNNNFDEAYVGIGKSYYREGDYQSAMKMYEAAYETSNYSTAFKQYRKDWVAKYALVVPLVVVVVIVGLYFFFRFVGKRNKEVATRPGGRRSYGEEVIFAFHLMMHPFDGFWDLKHEKRGSIRGALTWLAIAIAAFTYNGIGTAYLFNPSRGYQSVFGQIISIVVPVGLWVVSNWCLTTLFEGEGSLKDIFIATCYSLVPIPLCIVPATLFSHILSLSEGKVISLITGVMWVWVGMLVFFGSQVTHDYSFIKNIFTTIGTIVGMAFIMFVALLFTNLIQKIVGFVANIVTEISYRI
ncbi:MAG: YIP1 family protein [Clostridia bacterium]|nr:YIP1 family protein [Clostridia bacterium]